MALAQSEGVQTLGQASATREHAKGQMFVPTASQMPNHPIQRGRRGLQVGGWRSTIQAALKLKRLMPVTRHTRTSTVGQLDNDRILVLELLHVIIRRVRNSLFPPCSNPVYLVSSPYYQCH